MLNNLQEWLNKLETLHPSEIDLGLERVGSVWNKMCPDGLDCSIVSVAGTNGKGSCVAMLEAILQAEGYRTGCFTSPHLLRYNERIHVDGLMVEDDEIVEAFQRIDQARGDISLTYFEFGTLAALDIFARQSLDVVILEVGLGGRLDAVNILDADVALITSIDLDHTEWLGHTREKIAIEKAGIFRPQKPAVFGGLDMPDSIRTEAKNKQTPLYVLGKDYHYLSAPGGWIWRGPMSKRTGLPEPILRGSYQLANAAAVLMTLDCLAGQLPVSQVAVRRGLNTAAPEGRFQVFPGDPTIVLDVAHNPHAAQALVGNLSQQFVKGQTYGVVGMLSDKAVGEVASILQSQVDVWYPASLPGGRGQSSASLRQALLEVGIATVAGEYDNPKAAYLAAGKEAGEGDRILVFGSFLMVADVLPLI